MTEEAWDFDHQRAETHWTCQQLLGDNPLLDGALIHLELQFIPADGADPDAAVRALKTFGFEAHVIHATQELEASVDGIPFSADAIWEQEERATRIILSRGYKPDGWGFWEPQG